MDGFVSRALWQFCRVMNREGLMHGGYSNMLLCRGLAGVKLWISATLFCLFSASVFVQTYDYA